MKCQHIYKKFESVLIKKTNGGLCMRNLLFYIHVVSIVFGVLLCSVPAGAGDVYTASFTNPSPINMDDFTEQELSFTPQITKSIWIKEVEVTATVDLSEDNPEYLTFEIYIQANKKNIAVLGSTIYSGQTYTEKKQTNYVLDPEVTVTFDIKATSVYGGVISSGVTTVKFYAENVAYRAKVTGVPENGYTNNNNVVLTVSGEGIQFYKYSTDGTTYSSVINRNSQPSFTVDCQTDGTYQVYVLGGSTENDSETNNWQDPQNPTIVEWIADHTAPIITGLENDTTPRTSKTWNWNAEDSSPVTFRYAIDQNGTWTPTGEYSNVKTATKKDSPINATYYLHVEAKDLAGNVAQKDVSVQLLDSIKPVVTINRNPNQDTHDGTYTITISATDQGTPNPPIQYQLNSGNWTAYQNPLTYDAEGAYTINARSTDNQGNTGNATVSFTIVSKGDIDQSGKVDLNDAIKGFRILVGLAVTLPNDVIQKVDVNGDNRIGPEEIIYILQKVANKR